ncbi:hypothetical protein E2C01_093071 [Portunus trituberculatus]|uniref:Secreted protein n=1 Tax=Portunus trituberculatus TaxID=210409 RepID=A0A5B7JNU7_PORTR|nr:hypothetical protein [Portunus trituberculatus]
MQETKVCILLALISCRCDALCGVGYGAGASRHPIRVHCRCLHALRGSVRGGLHGCGSACVHILGPGNKEWHACS